MAVLSILIILGGILIALIIFKKNENKYEYVKQIKQESPIRGQRATMKVVDEASGLNMKDSKIVSIEEIRFYQNGKLLFSGKLTSPEIEHKVQDKGNWR